MSPVALRVSRLFWPLPPAYVLGPAAAILVLTLAASWGELSWRALDWAYLSAEVGARARLPVVVAAGAAALVAARFSRPTLVFAQRWQPRVEHDLPTRHCAVISGWCLAAYVVGLSPLTLAVASHGAGLPDVVAIAGALMGFVALTVFGYLCGVALRGPLAVPLAIGAVFLFSSLPLVADAWSALALQLPVSPSLGSRESPALGPYRLGFFLLLTVALGWTVSSLLRTPRRVSTAQAVTVAAVATAIVLPHLRPFPLLAYAEQAAQVCEEHQGIRYCVHDGHLRELAPIIDLAAPVFDAYGRPSAAPDEIRDLSLARDDGDVLQGSERDVLWLRVYPGWDPYEEVPASAVAWLVPNVFRCESNGVARGEPQAELRERRAAVVHDLRDWLIAHAHGARPDDGLFASASPDEVRAWIRRDEERLATCEVDPGDLPWRT